MTLIKSNFLLDSQQNGPGISVLARNNADPLSFLFATPDKTVGFIRIKTIKEEKEFFHYERTRGSF